MKELLFMMLMITLSMSSFAEIKVKIHQPVRFKNVNTQAYGDLVVGQGSIEVFSTEFEKDYKKKIKFRFPEEGVMTNKKRWIKVEKFKMADKDKEFEMLQEKRIVNFYAFLRRKDINLNEKDGTLVEGEYIGYTPIIIEQYGQPINNVPTPLPVFPDKDGPTLLPSFPDEEMNRPMPLSMRKRGGR